jgi:hypothetical protein
MTANDGNIHDGRRLSDALATKSSRKLVLKNDLERRDYSQRSYQQHPDAVWPLQTLKHAEALGRRQILGSELTIRLPTCVYKMAGAAPVAALRARSGKTGTHPKR